MERKKLSFRRIKRWLILGLAVLLVLAICFTAGALWSQGRTRTEITATVLSQRLRDISELATVEYRYTNMGKFENQVDFYGWAVPLTKKSFIISYDGVIRAGIDASEITAEISGNVITVHLPEAKILSHEIDDDSLEIFDETRNIFNPLKIEDYTTFSADQRAETEQKAIANGLLTEAHEKAKATVQQLLTLAIAEPERYEFIIT